MIRVVVIDDEPLARSGVIARLAKHDDFQVIGEYADGVAALDGIRRDLPDLLLLDIQMPALDGFGMLDELPVERRPMVIFLTAYDDFAVRAFDHRAIDYLLKPIDEERFEDSLNRARELYSMRARVDGGADCATHGDSSGTHRTRFSVRMGRRVVVVDAAEVEWIEADGDYATLHTVLGNYLLRDSLTALSEQLDPAHFVRVHRSTIVRLDRVAELQSLTNRDVLIRLRDGTPIRVSRTYAADLLSRLGKTRVSR